MARAANDKTVLGSVWLREEPERTRAPLSRDDIVETAIKVLDRDGLEQLSMRRMAVELGNAATSALYWRIANKNDLLELAVDAVIGGALVEADQGDWRDQLTTLAHAAYGVLADHPWAPQLPVMRGSGRTIRPSPSACWGCSAQRGSRGCTWTRPSRRSSTMSWVPR
ncbi:MULTISPECIES: TetR/AcrR family transcriptional regulator [Kribbella]|uniref:TetR/AcrR family transcriptional regulator n=1 Tax=Kribbella TaxID=182639 RepID=UPI001F54272C|nr:MULTISPECIES: TetR/AcrR family transcriptional regulator [Kribbella]